MVSGGRAGSRSSSTTGPRPRRLSLDRAGRLRSRPLNPATAKEELAFYLDDLGAQALVVGATLDSPAREVAAERGHRVLELHVNPAAPAGVFTLSRCAAGIPRQRVGPSRRDVVALVLHTSGTTSRPKLVPLTQRNLAPRPRTSRGRFELEPATAASTSCRSFTSTASSRPALVARRRAPRSPAAPASTSFASSTGSTS